jgi:hypothetical protein
VVDRTADTLLAVAIRCADDAMAQQARQRLAALERCAWVIREIGRIRG